MTGEDDSSDWDRFSDDGNETTSSTALSDGSGPASQVARRSCFLKLLSQAPGGLVMLNILQALPHLPIAGTWYRDRIGHMQHATLRMKVLHTRLWQRVKAKYSL